MKNVILHSQILINYFAQETKLIYICNLVIVYFKTKIAYFPTFADDYIFSFISTFRVSLVNFPCTNFFHIY